MAESRRTVEERVLYEKYLRALKRHGPPEGPSPSPGHVIRLCHACGQHAMFRLDPEGNWYECLHCGQYA